MRASDTVHPVRPPVRVAFRADDHRLRTEPTRRGWPSVLSWPRSHGRLRHSRGCRVPSNRGSAVLTGTTRWAAGRCRQPATSLTALPPQREHLRNQHPKPHSIQRKPIPARVVPAIDGINPPAATIALASPSGTSAIPLRKSCRLPVRGLSISIHSSCGVATLIDPLS